MLARRDGFFWIDGLEGPASEALGPLLPAICAGITIALTLVMVDVVGGPVVGVLAAFAVLILPDFIPLHRTSLLGPPLVATTVTMLAVMLAAPRFSLAYGAIAAFGAVFVSPAGVGLVLAAFLWSWMQPPNGRGRLWRAGLALFPLLVAVAVGLFVQSAWPAEIMLERHAGLDAVLRATGAVLGEQLVPTITLPVLRWLMVADTTLILLALVVMGWQAARLRVRQERLLRFYPAVGVLAASYLVGMFVHSMVVAGAPLPGTSAVLPIATLATITVAVSVGALWRDWRSYGKGIAVVLLGGWMMAALLH